MNHLNSLKYLKGFKPGIGADGVSIQRLCELCMSLGKINVGLVFADIAGTVSGHATALILEHAISYGGYNVGYICENYSDENFTCVRINGEPPSISVFASATSELARIVGAAENSAYRAEEIKFALALLICRMCGCHFVVMEMSPELHTGFDYVCNPASVAVIPSVYGNDNIIDEIGHGCEVIKRGAVEAVCGIMSREAHDMLVAVCVDSGTRLSSAIGGSVRITSMSPRKTTFDYKKCKDIVVGSSSQIMVDAAITVAEILARIKHFGIHVKQDAMKKAIENTRNTGCFEIISLCPNIIVHAAGNFCEMRLLEKNIHDCKICDGGRLYICADDSCAQYAEEIFSGGERTTVMSLGDDEEIPFGITEFMMTEGHLCDTVIFVGEMHFVQKIKSRIKKQLNMPL